MTRPLLNSERRTIRNIAIHSFGSDIAGVPDVVSEAHDEQSKPAHGPVLNADFRLSFYRRTLEGANIESKMMPILPNTLGAEIFLTIDATTKHILLLQLLGGAAFTYRFYESYVNFTERKIREAQRQEVPKGSLESPAVNENVERRNTLFRAKACAYVRFLVFPDEICFYMQKSGRSFEPRGTISPAWRCATGEIDCYRENGIAVGYDGWIAMKSAPTDHKLLARIVGE